MPRILRYILYVLLFAFCFAFFLYWTFPFDMLKGRIVTLIEQQAGEGVDVSIGSLESYWFTGVEVTDLVIERSDAEGAKKPLLKVRSGHARAGVFSLVFGSPRIKFMAEIGKGEFSGVAQQTEGELFLDMDIDDINPADLKFITDKTGLNFSGNINGSVRLSIDKQKPARSTGKVSLSLDNISILESQVMLGEMPLPLPALDLSGKKGSAVRLSMDKGAIEVEEFKFAGGDIGIDLKGKIFFSARSENYRFNLSGAFSASEKLAQALPFIYMVDKQKREDGTYPLLITGRLGHPSVKIGTFTVPL